MPKLKFFAGLWKLTMRCIVNIKKQQVVYPVFHLQISAKPLFCYSPGCLTCRVQSRPRRVVEDWLDDDGPLPTICGREWRGGRAAGMKAVELRCQKFPGFISICVRKLRVCTYNQAIHLFSDYFAPSASCFPHQANGPIAQSV